MATELAFLESRRSGLLAQRFSFSRYADDFNPVACGDLDEVGDISLAVARLSIPEDEQCDLPGQRQGVMQHPEVISTARIIAGLLLQPARQLIHIIHFIEDEEPLVLPRGIAESPETLDPA